MAFRPFVSNLLSLDGTPESGGLLQSYVRGTTTPSPLYSDAGGTTPRTNPLVTDSLGEVAPCYFNDALEYSWQAKTADGSVTLWQADVVAGVLSLTFVNPLYTVYPIVDLTAVRSVPTYAALTALQASNGLIDGAVYCTKARASVDDGGYGFWRYDAASTTTANAGTILAINGGGAGRFFRMVGTETEAAWFGIKPETTAITDYLALCQAMISAIAANPVQTPRTVRFGYGEIGLSAEWLITTPVWFVGQGDIGGAVDSLPYTVGTTFKRIGATTGNAVIKFYNINFGGFGVNRVSIDGGMNCQYALYVDACCGYDFNNVAALGGTIRAWWVRASTATNSFTSIRNSRAYGNPTALECIRFSGPAGEANACHIHFESFMANVAGDSSAGFICKGITFAGCDNVRGSQVFCYVVDTNAVPNPPYSIGFDFTEQTNFPSNNSIFGLETTSGIEPIAGRGSYSFVALQVYGWMLDNALASRRSIDNSGGGSIVYVIDDHGIIYGSPGFDAYKNGTNQTGIANLTPTTITFPTATRNIGGLFNTGTSVFTSPGGRLNFKSQVYVSGGVDAGAACTISLYENGAQVDQGTSRAQATNEAILWLDRDYETVVGRTYEIKVRVATSTGGTDTATVSGSSVLTYFQVTLAL